MRSRTLKWVCTARPKLGVFYYYPKYSFIVAFTYQRTQKPQQWSLIEVIEDILPFVFNTKRTLSNIWLLSYKQNNFGCFWEKLKLWFLSTLFINSSFPASLLVPFYLSGCVLRNIWKNSIFFFLISSCPSSWFNMSAFLHFDMVQIILSYLFMFLLWSPSWFFFNLD